MKVLHYAVRLSAIWRGGLPKYSFDLMCEESNLGNDIILLYPGEYTPFKKAKIVSNEVRKGVKIYKIVNPQLVPLSSGIGEPQDFYKKCINKDVYGDFIKNIKPDIIHVHTLLGLHKELLEVAKEYGIKIVFTTHDYFGLCPKINLLDYKNEICNNYEKGNKCILCNSNSYSSKFVYIKNSSLYKKLKSNKICSNLLRKLKNNRYDALTKKNNEERNERNNISNKTIDLKKSKEYIALRNYYLDIFKLINYFHFNSSISKNEFKKYIDTEGEIISITHNDIKDMRVKKSVEKNKELRLTYLGPTESYKGFYLLKESLDILQKNEVINWVLNVYGNYKNSESNNCKIIFNGIYDYKMIKNIFDNTDILIVPSICRETFGFIGLEALSYGVPVMLTDNVGMQDIIVNNVTGIIVKPDSIAISEAIKRVINNRDILNEINEHILKMDFQYTMDIHAKKIIDLYKKVINK